MTCASVAGSEKARVDSLIIRSGLLLDRVKFCAAQVVVAEPSRRAVEDERAHASGEIGRRKAGCGKAGRDGEAGPRRHAEPRKLLRSARKPQSRQSSKLPALRRPSRRRLRPRRASEDAAQAVASAAAAANKPAANEFDYLKRYAVQAGSPPDQPAEDEDCLVVTKTSPASYLIENKNCRPQIVLTAIELNRAGTGDALLHQEDCGRNRDCGRGRNARRRSISNAKRDHRGVQRECCGGCFQNASLDSCSAQPGT